MKQFALSFCFAIFMASTTHAHTLSDECVEFLFEKSGIEEINDYNNLSSPTEKKFVEKDVFEELDPRHYSFSAKSHDILDRAKKCFEHPAAKKQEQGHPTTSKSQENDAARSLRGWGFKKDHCFHKTSRPSHKRRNARECEADCSHFIWDDVGNVCLDKNKSLCSEAWQAKTCIAIRGCAWRQRWWRPCAADNWFGEWFF
jgi:hypothetical protein